MEKIYLLVANVDYEGFSLVRAYASKSDAQKAAEDANEYHKTKPTWSGDYDNETEWDEWDKAVSEWQRLHPAAPEYWADNFGVIDAPFVASNSVGA